MPVTIRDLANRLNLSITQVSRALSGYSDVSDATREKVTQAAREMGYEPSYAARQLRRKRADAIGYILPTSSPRFSDPFYANFLTGLCDEAAKHQIDLVVASCPPESELEETMYQRWSQSTRVDGIVINRVRIHDWRVDYLAQNQMPFVTLGIPESNHEFPAIQVNERGGFERMALHLKEKGHKRIAFIGGPPELVIQRERFAGYKQGLSAAGLDYDDGLVIEGNLTEDGGYNAARKLLGGVNPPTAIMACNDQSAIGAMRAAKEGGCKIGERFSVTGYDGIREAEYADPPLTTLYQPTYEIARQLTAMLVNLINHEPISPLHRQIEPELIIRASTEARN